MGLADVIGLLAFGKDFGGVESGMSGFRMNIHSSLTDYDPGKTHAWISDVLDSMSQASFSDTLARFPWAGKLYMLLRPGWLKGLMAASQRHQTYTIELTTR